MRLQERSCGGQIWLTEVTQSENGESRDRFAKQSGKKVLDSWHINTKTELCGRFISSPLDLRGGICDSTAEVCVHLQTITCYTASLGNEN